MSTNSPWRLALLSECPRGRKAVPGDSHSDSSARKVDPISLATRARFRGTAGSTRSQRALGPVPETPQVNQISRAFLAPLQGPAGLSSCPGPLVLASKGPRGRPAVPGDWGPSSKFLGVDQPSRATRAWIRSPVGQPDIPGDSSPDPRAHGVIKLSQGLRPGPEALRGGPALPGHTRLRPRACGVDQLYLATGVQV